MSDPPGTRVSVERLMRQIEGEVARERRARLIARGGPAVYADPEVYTAVERVLKAAATARDTDALLLPELLGDEDEWRLRTWLEWSSHRPVSGGPIIFIKRRLLLPLMRWLYDYSRENFKRQDRVNRVLFACVEELAIENAELRKRLAALIEPAGPPASGGR